MQIPMLGVVTDIRRDTPDIKTFRVNTITGEGKCFEHKPGQCAMLSIPGVGEAMFSITSSPTETRFQENGISLLKRSILLQILLNLKRCSITTAKVSCRRDTPAVSLNRAKKAVSVSKQPSPETVSVFFLCCCAIK